MCCCSCNAVFSINEPPASAAPCANLPHLTPSNFTFPFLSFHHLGRSCQHETLIKIIGAHGLSLETVGQQKEASGWLLDYLFVRNRIRERRTERFRAHGGLQLVSPLDYAGPWETGPQVGHTTHDERAAKMKPASRLHFICGMGEEENSKAVFSLNFDVQPSYLTDFKAVSSSHIT